MIAWFVIRPLAILSLVAGVMAIPTPVPIGAVLIAVGLALFVMTSVTARRLMRRVRTASSWADGWLGLVEPRLGRRLGIALRRTRPVRPRDSGA